MTSSGTIQRRRAAVVLYACLPEPLDERAALQILRTQSAARDWASAAEIVDRCPRTPLDQRPGWARALALLGDGTAHGIVTVTSRMLGARGEADLTRIRNGLATVGAFLALTPSRRTPGQRERRQLLAEGVAFGYGAGAHRA